MTNIVSEFVSDDIDSSLLVDVIDLMRVIEQLILSDNDQSPVFCGY